MKQIAQHIRSGALSVADVPPPAAQRGMVLVKTCFSVISAGTEKTSIDSRKASMLQRARSQPDEVRKMLAEMKKNGVLRVATRVLGKLDSHAALGYSSAGVVLAVDPVIQDIRVGDRVACAGAEYASHADIVAVPRNLVAPIPDGVSMETAAYTTIAAIALQGIRQAGPTLGETVAVIGLGLLGNLTVQMLKANGCRVVGIDLDPAAVALAREAGADAAVLRAGDPVESVVASLSGGHGADAVIITAGTSSNDPIELAGRLVRERGTVVVVGAASMDIPRGSFYMKEVDVRISRSYGPGRYDTDYEKDGLDYPIGYVRWTENRNMQAFLQLAAEGRVDTQRITTHRFPIERAAEAYHLIEGEKSEPYVGIVLTYGDVADEDLAAVGPAEGEAPAPRISPSRSSLRLGFIGAGSFAAGYLLPHLKGIEDVTLDTVCNRSGLTGADMRNKFGFMRSTTDAQQVFGDVNIGTVFIATRHGDHARYTREALLHGQHVFVEKPLALNEEELAALEAVVTGNPEMRGRQLLMVGYNRRFAPLVTEMKDFFASTREPAVVHYYVNAGFLPKDHWTQDLLEGGGRIIGEGCHFIDTIQFLTGALPVRVSADCAVSRSAHVTNYDNVQITLQMSDGSLGLVTYVANGDSSVGKERITMSAGNSTAVMDNFQELLLARGGKQRTVRSNGDKGHRDEVRAFIDAIRRKLPELIPYDSLFATTRATFAAVAALNTREPVDLGSPAA